MTGNTRKSRSINLVILGIVILLGSTIIFAGVEGESYKFSEKRINLTMIGGYAHSEGLGGMADLNLEIQFSLSSYVRTGLGVGYLSGNDDMHISGYFDNMQVEMMGGMGGGMMDGFSGHGHNLKIVPITLSLYYFLPINPKLDIFMLGGWGYYIGSDRDQSTQNESSFGPHVGLGLDFKVSERVEIVAEGFYRFVSLKGFLRKLHEGFREGMVGEEYDEEWHFHEEHENEQHTLMDVPSFDISLNGISLRVGIKFGF